MSATHNTTWWEHPQFCILQLLSHNGHAALFKGFSDSFFSHAHHSTDATLLLSHASLAGRETIFSHMPSLPFNGAPVGWRFLLLPLLLTRLLNVNCSHHLVTTDIVTIAPCRICSILPHRQEGDSLLPYMGYLSFFISSPLPLQLLWKTWWLVPSAGDVCLIHNMCRIY